MEKIDASEREDSILIRPWSKATGNNSTLPPNTILIVVPWLEGGGAQGALEGILRRLPRHRLVLVILFSGNRNHGQIKKLVSRTIEFDCPRTITGVARASVALRPLVSSAEKVYSLMRASHLVLGLGSAKVLQAKHLVASFHQLPSVDGAGLQGKLEDFLVRRGLRSASMVTTPSIRAAHELRQMGFGRPRSVVVEHNLIAADSRPLSSPRIGELRPLRLLFAGRITYQKGLDRIPDLVSGIETPLHIRCFGDGESASEVADVFRSTIAHHTIELHSHTSTISEEIDWADAVFMPSRWELNPLLVWEARSRGRATIASRIEAFQDLAESGPVYLFHDGAELSDIVTKFASSQSVRLKSFEAAVKSFRDLEKGSTIVEALNA